MAIIASPSPMPSPMPSLTTTAVVTGASRGLGLAIVRQLLHLRNPGVRVVLAARTPEAANGAAAALQREGYENVCGYALDVCNPRSVAEISAAIGHVDLLINNAAICPVAWTPASANLCWRTNVLGPLALTQAVLPGMLRRRRGHVVHISSGDGELAYLNTALQAALQDATSDRDVLRTLARAAPPRNTFGSAPAHGPTPAYSTSKAALNALTRLTAARLPPPEAGGVLVSAVCPGDVATRMLSTHDPEAVRQALPPAAAARDVVTHAMAGLCMDSAKAAMPSGRFWRHGTQLEF